jgi:hypothetical protein
MFQSEDLKPENVQMRRLQARDRQRFVAAWLFRQIWPGGGDSQTHVRYYYYHFLCCAAAGRVKTAQWDRGCGRGVDSASSCKDPIRGSVARYILLASRRPSWAASSSLLLLPSRRDWRDKRVHCSIGISWERRIAQQQQQQQARSHRI